MSPTPLHSHTYHSLQMKTDQQMSHELRTPLHHIMGFLSLVLDAPDLSPRHQKHLVKAHDAAVTLITRMNVKDEYHHDIEMEENATLPSIQEMESTCTSPIPESSTSHQSTCETTPSVSRTMSTTLSSTPTTSLPSTPRSCDRDDDAVSMVVSTCSSPTIKSLSPHSPPPNPSNSQPHPPARSSTQPIPLRRVRRNSISVTPIPEHLFPIRILVADDSKVNCKLLAEFCSQLRVDVEFAANGQECLEKFIARHEHEQSSSSESSSQVVTWNGKESNMGMKLTAPPTMILMDLDMPIMNGYICTARIRSYQQQHQLNTTPIISISASTPNQHVDGMDASLWKPVSIHTLRDCIVTWAEHRLNMIAPSTSVTVSDGTISGRGHDDSGAPAHGQLQDELSSMSTSECQMTSPIQSPSPNSRAIITRSTPLVQRRLHRAHSHSHPHPHPHPHPPPCSFQLQVPIPPLSLSLHLSPPSPSSLVRPSSRSHMRRPSLSSNPSSDPIPIRPSTPLPSSLSLSLSSSSPTDESSSPFINHSHHTCTSNEPLFPPIRSRRPSISCSTFSATNRSDISSSTPTSPSTSTCTDPMYISWSTSRRSSISETQRVSTPYVFG